MSFEIAPNATLSEYTLPTAVASTIKSAPGVERFMFGLNSENGKMKWAAWGTSISSTSASPTTWYTTPTNDTSSGGNYDYGDHKFSIMAYAYGLRRIYVTGQGRIGNTPYPTTRISFANEADLRTSETTFPNIAFTKCDGTFPNAILPYSIGCTDDGQKIIVTGRTIGTNTGYVMGSTNYGNSWFSIPLPTATSMYLSSGTGDVHCDGNFFYILDLFGLHKISVNFSSSSTSSDWTKVDLYTTSSPPSYAYTGYRNLRIFNLDDTSTNKLYTFTFSNQNGAGIFVSSDGADWRCIVFDQLAPSFVGNNGVYIPDISFANRFGNAIVVIANTTKFDNNEKRFVLYTYDLTGRTGWVTIQPTAMSPTNSYDITSVCITPDKRYFIFDRLGSVYYTSNLSLAFTKVAISAGELPFDTKVYFIDGSSYERSSLGNLAYDSNDAISYNYNSDSYKEGDSNANRKWTKQNLTFGSNDDSYSNQPVNIGFDWGYNGSTYNSFRLNTNGQLHFNNFSGTYIVESGDRIIANYGDLWLNPALINTTGPAETRIISTNTTVTPSVLRSQYKINTTQSGDYILFSLDVNADEPCAMWLTIAGYNIAGGYIPITGGGLADYEGFKLNLGEQLSQITSFDVSYCNSYANYIKTNFPGLPLTGLLNNNTHGAWTKNLSWVDNGVQHNIFRMAVYCGQYGNSAKDHSYRVSLYKAGASQKISISALSRFSHFVYAKTSVAGKNCGPYPAANNASLKALLDYDETTWYSDDNGSTWYLNNKDGTTKSTVVQMGPPQASTNISLNRTKVYLNTNRTNRYAATDAWDSSALGINQNVFGYPDAINIKVGPTMHLMLIRYIAGERTSDVFGETQLFNVFDTTYTTEINKNVYSYKYGDIDRNGGVELGDAMDMQRIASGAEPNGINSITGANLLVEYLLNSYPPSIIDTAFYNGWIVPNTTTMSSMFDNSRMLPGVKNLTTSNTADIKASALSELGPVYRLNVNGKIYNPAPDWKPIYGTAKSSRVYRA
jgi:hypothetical protein